MAGEQTVTRSVTQLARVGGVISGKEAKAASQRLSLGSWLLVTTSRPPVPFTMTKTGRYGKRKNKARHCHSEFRPLGEGDRSQPTDLVAVNTTWVGGFSRLTHGASGARVRGR